MCVDHLRRCIQGETGCGKSTRVPVYVMEDAAGAGHEPLHFTNEMEGTTPSSSWGQWINRTIHASQNGTPKNWPFENGETGLHTLAVEVVYPIFSRSVVNFITQRRTPEEYFENRRAGKVKKEDKFMVLCTQPRHVAVWHVRHKIII